MKEENSTPSKIYPFILWNPAIQAHLQNWQRFTAEACGSWQVLRALRTMISCPYHGNTSLCKHGYHEGIASKAYWWLLHFFYADLLRPTNSERPYTNLPSAGASRILRRFGRSRPPGFECHLHKGQHACDGEGPAGQGGETPGKLSIQKFSRQTFGNKRDQVKQVFEKTMSEGVVLY